jgi:hypothetical protein
MAVRSKFVCSEISNSSGSTDENGKTIKLGAVIAGSDENNEFFRWTPSGSISLTCVSVEASKQFEVGKEYYVDFTPAS